MAGESSVYKIEKEKGRMAWLDVALRAVAVGATISAAVVMGTDKQNTVISISPTLSYPVKARFNYTPSFVFFVAVNAIACGYAAVTLLSTLMVKHVLKSPHSHVHQIIVAFFDLVIVAALSAGASAATAISEVGKNGNKHSQWDKICNKVGRFCERGGGALIASFVGVVIFMLLNIMATHSLYKRTRTLASALTQ